MVAGMLVGILVMMYGFVLVVLAIRAVVTLWVEEGKAVEARRSKIKSFPPAVDNSRKTTDVSPVQKRPAA